MAQNTSKSSSSLRKGRRSGTEFQCGQAPLLEDDETPIVLRRAQILQVVSGQLPGYQTNIVNGQSAPRQVSNFWWFSFSAKVPDIRNDKAPLQLYGTKYKRDCGPLFTPSKGGIDEEIRIKKAFNVSLSDYTPEECKNT